MEPRSERIFRAVCNAVVPEAAALPEAGWRDGMAAVETALAPQPETTKRQLRLFLQVLEQSARPRFGAPFTRLSPQQATRHLKSFERSPVSLLRKGFWGVRTLALMAYYARPEGAASVGYRGDPRGWTAREVVG